MCMWLHGRVQRWATEAVGGTPVKPLPAILFPSTQQLRVAPRICIRPFALRAEQAWVRRSVGNGLSQPRTLQSIRALSCPVMTGKRRLPESQLVLLEHVRWT